MEKEKNAEIIDRIKYLMKEMGLKQVQFAERIGVDTSNLSKYLNAHMPPDAVDDGGFARPRFPGDQEQMLIGQRCGIKVDYGMLDGCDIVDCEFLEFHCLFASWTN